MIAANMKTGGTTETARQLGELMKKYSLPAGTNKAALKRVMDRLGADKERIGSGHAKTKSWPLNGRGINEVETTSNASATGTESDENTKSSKNRNNSKNGSPKKYQQSSATTTNAETVIATSKNVENVLLGIPSSRELIEDNETLATFSNFAEHLRKNRTQSVNAPCKDGLVQTKAEKKAVKVVQIQRNKDCPDTFNRMQPFQVKKEALLETESERASYSEIKAGQTDDDSPQDDDLVLQESEGGSIEGMLHAIDIKRKNKVIGQLRQKLGEMSKTNKDLDNKLKKKEVELREMRAKATQLQREKGALASSALAGTSLSTFRKTQLTTDSLVLGSKNKDLIMSNSNHKQNQRINVLMKKYSILELRAAQAEAELAEAKDLVHALNDKIHVLDEREELSILKQNQYETELSHLRPLPSMLRNARTDIKNLRRTVNASVSETAQMKSSLVTAEDDKFKLKSNNVELMQLKNKKVNKIFTLEERLKSANEKLQLEVTAKAKVIEETIKLEDRMAMLRMRCRQMEKNLSHEKRIKESLMKECAMKEEECALMASMVSNPSAILSLENNSNSVKVNGKQQKVVKVKDASAETSAKNDMDSLIEALENVENENVEMFELEATLNNLRDQTGCDHELEQKSEFVSSDFGSADAYTHSVTDRDIFTRP